MLAAQHATCQWSMCDHAHGRAGQRHNLAVCVRWRGAHAKRRACWVCVVLRAGAPPTPVSVVVGREGGSQNELLVTLFVGPPALRAGRLAHPSACGGHGPLFDVALGGSPRRAAVASGARRGAAMQGDAAGRWEHIRRAREVGKRRGATRAHLPIRTPCLLRFSRTSEVELSL
jgi:hypothetical protein